MPKTSITFSKADIRHNMIVLIMIDAIWGIGATEMTLAAGPLYVYLKASNTTIGLIGSLAFLGLFGVIISPFITRKFRVKKWYLLIVHIPYLGAWGLIGLGLVLSQKLGLSREWLLMFIIAMSAANWFFAGFVSLPHNEYAASCIPMSHRGRFSGYSVTIGSGVGILSNMLGGLILLHVAKPMAYGYLYILTWLICQSGYLLALLGRERPVPVENSPIPWSRAMIKAALHDKPYMRVMLLFGCYSILFTPLLLTFVPVYGFRELGMIPAMAAVIGLIQKLVNLTTSPFLGHITDRYSPKRLLTYWPLAAFAAMLPVILLDNHYAVYIASGLAIIYWSGLHAAFNALVYGLPSPENRAGHFTFQILTNYVATAAGPFLAGTLCDKLNYKPTFAIMAALALLLFPVSKYLLSPLSDRAQDYV